MKKLLSLLLAVTLLGSLALPAAAADDASSRLTKVTQAVKNTLQLDTGAYGDFEGECYDEELAPIWHLRWWDGPDDASLNVEALEDGTVISYRKYVSDSASYRREGLPAFPKETDAAAERKEAEAFLKKVLASNETVELKEKTETARFYDTSRYFSGKIALNGVPSPLNCSVTVKDGEIIRFSRGAPSTTFLGAVPSPTATASQDKAAADLREKLAVKLEYVLPDDGDGKRAVLYYVPEEDLHTFYADANTGTVLDLTALEEGMGGYGFGKNESAADMAATMASAGGEEDRGLSMAEQAGVEKLAGVLSTEKLDAALRSTAAYNLKGYTLASTSYTLQKDRPVPLKSIETGDGGAQEESKPVCRLRYIRTDEEESYSRTFTVDARSGEVLNLYSSAPWGKNAVLTEEQARAKAEAFLKDFAADRTIVFRKTSGSGDSKAPYYRFLFSREANGYPFAANYYNVSIDNLDGSVCGLDYEWDDAITFDSTDGILSAEAAKTAWADTYDVTLEYRLVPQDLDAKDPVQARLIGQGMKRYYGLRLTYGLSREDYCQGIDAKTGKAVTPPENTSSKEIAYTDLNGSSAKADIEKLARYGIGYAAPEFQPGKGMTQWEFICLLASTNGQRLDPAAATTEERNDAYASAYSLDALTRSERADESALTSGALVKMLLNAAGYGPAARLTGIYTSDYSDQASIPAADLGYAAIAQALGMAKGTYGAARNVSRAEAASMLCRLMERS